MMKQISSDEGWRLKSVRINKFIKKDFSQTFISVLSFTINIYLIKVTPKFFFHFFMNFPVLTISVINKVCIHLLLLIHISCNFIATQCGNYFYDTEELCASKTTTTQLESRWWRKILVK